MNEPPQDLPEEFKEDWQTIHQYQPEALAPQSWVRWRAALLEVAALNMQVVVNEKANAAKRDQLRAEREVERLEQRIKAYGSRLCDLEDLLEKKNAALERIEERFSEHSEISQIAREARELS